jgi:uncharacterized repeat protein (TIGR04138 family)
MPPTTTVESQSQLERLAAGEGQYPVDAYEFLQRGLAFTVSRIHGQTRDAQGNLAAEPRHHVSGRELCEGLRDFALLQWGLMARAVLERWNIHGTIDFGRIVFILVRHRFMLTSKDDTLADFDSVYDFAKAFDSEYRISGCS